MALSRSKHWTHGFLLGAGNRSYSWGVIPNVCNYLGHSWPIGLITFGFLINRNFDQRLVTFWGWCDLFPFPKLEVQALQGRKATSTWLWGTEGTITPGKDCHRLLRVFQHCNPVALLRVITTGRLWLETTPETSSWVSWGASVNELNGEPMHQLTSLSQII